MKKMKHVTQEEFDANPIIAQLGGEVGDKIAVSLPDDKQAEVDAEVAAAEAAAAAEKEKGE
jgi:phage tail protein X